MEQTDWIMLNKSIAKTFIIGLMTVVTSSINKVEIQDSSFEDIEFHLILICLYKKKSYGLLYFKKFKKFSSSVVKIRKNQGINIKHFYTHTKNDVSAIVYFLQFMSNLKFSI